MKEIRLLQVVPSLNFGGVEQGTIDIARAMSEKGHTSMVASNGGLLVSKLTNYGINHFNLPVNTKNPVKIFLNINKIKKIVLNNKINIIHSRSRAPAWSSYYAGRNKIKLVSTFHNVYGHNNYFKILYASGLAKADAIIAISDYVKDKIIKIYNIPEKKIEVIYRGIDENEFDPENIQEESLIKIINKYNITYDKKIILFPGRLTRWKGQIEFLNVLKQIETKDFVCLFVGGTTNTRYSKSLYEKINQLGLGVNCKIVGHISEMKYIYKLSNVVINASLRPEGFGRTIAEAMAMERPIVAYDHGAVSEQMKNYDKNFKIKLNESSHMARAIDQILNISQESIENIGKESRKFMKKKYTKKNMINQTIDFYKKLLK